MILDADMLWVFNLLFLNTRKLIDITRHADVRFLRKDLERMKGDKLFFTFICLFVFLSAHITATLQTKLEMNPTMASHFANSAVRQSHILHFSTSNSSEYSLLIISQLSRGFRTVKTLFFI